MNIDTASYPAGRPTWLGRASNILFKPTSEWRRIAEEPSSIKFIYLWWILPLIAIPAIEQFIVHRWLGYSTGQPMLAFWSTAANAALLFVGVLAFFPAQHLVVYLVAPLFGGERNALKALKVSAYAAVPDALVHMLQPFPNITGWVAAVGYYRFFLIVLGLMIVLKVPNLTRAILAMLVIFVGYTLFEVPFIAFIFAPIIPYLAWP